MEVMQFSCKAFAPGDRRSDRSTAGDRPEALGCPGSYLKALLIQDFLSSIGLKPAEVNAACALADQGPFGNLRSSTATAVSASAGMPSAKYASARSARASSTYRVV